MWWAIDPIERTQADAIRPALLLCISTEGLTGHFLIFTPDIMICIYYVIYEQQKLFSNTSLSIFCKVLLLWSDSGCYGWCACISMHISDHGLTPLFAILSRSTCSLCWGWLDNLYDIHRSATSSMVPFLAVFDGTLPSVSALEAQLRPYTSLLCHAASLVKWMGYRRYETFDHRTFWEQSSLGAGGIFDEVLVPVAPSRSSNNSSLPNSTLWHLPHGPKRKLFSSHLNSIVTLFLFVTITMSSKNSGTLPLLLLSSDTHISLRIQDPREQRLRVAVPLPLSSSMLNNLERILNGIGHAHPTTIRLLWYWLLIMVNRTGSSYGTRSFDPS